MTPIFDQAISEITTRLRQGRFPNEQSISQGIVLRVLEQLGWEVYDPTIVWPEYQTGEGRVDFALCYPPSKPAVFIEVKQPGKAQDGIRQALEYSFHTGVPFVVLTDGKTWSFYLPAEQGTYEDRRVYKLDLFEQDAEQSAKTLQKYLARDNVESGAALEVARTEYRSRNRRSVARQAIPEAWAELVENGDELLVDLLSQAVESKAGMLPDPNDIIEFLSNLAKPVIIQQPPSPPTKPQNPKQPRPPSTPPPKSPSETRQGTLILSGKAYPYANAKEAMVTLLQELASEDHSFLPRCAAHPDLSGRKRRYIARTKEEIYPDRPDLQDLHEALPGGWLVSTNLNNHLKKKIIKAACEVAELTYGSDVIVEF